jgi:hypothetical protein
MHKRTALAKAKQYEMAEEFTRALLYFQRSQSFIFEGLKIEGQ